MAELYRYAAFISYSSKDAKFAQRLHRALESYGIPSALGKFDIIGGGKQNRIYPVFRDREELSAGQLGDQIEANLKASTALIVVCSPNGAASAWVQKEIEFFASLGRHAKIFAIIPDTAPLVDEQGADCTQSCFPQAFRGDALSGDKLEPLAADARKGKDGFRNAWLKVVAGMVGVTPGQIIDRDRRRRRDQRRALVLGVAAAAAILSVVGAAIDARDARESMSARAMVLTGEGRPFDAIPFAVAGFPIPGDTLALPHRDARLALERTTGVGVIADLGRLVDTPGGFGFSGDGRFLFTLDADGNGALLDLRHLLTPPRALGLIRRDFGFRFSDDGNYLATRDSDDIGALLDLREPDGAPQPLGSVSNFSFSSDGRFLATRTPDGAYDLRNLNSLAIVSRSLGRLRDIEFSPDGRFLLALDQDLAGTLIDLSDLNTTPHSVGRMSNYGFSSDGRFLLTREPSGIGSLRDLHDPTLPTRPLGRLFESGAFGFSDDGRFLIIRDENVVATVRDLHNPGAAPRPLELFSHFGFSGDSRYLLTLNEESVGVLRDLHDVGSAPRLLGHMTSFAFSEDGRFLMTYDQGVSGRGLLYDMRSIDGAPRNLGVLTDFYFSGDGRFMITQNEDDTILHDLHNPDAPQLPLGRTMDFDFSNDGRFLVTRDYQYAGALRDTSVRLSGGAPGASFCGVSAQAVRPFARDVRENADDSLFLRLNGRPWNPCDWRGLLAIFPNIERGDGWFEGWRQWLRLMRVRHFHGRDYACEETTSAASTEARARRRDMCERFAPPPEPT